MSLVVGVTFIRYNKTIPYIINCPVSLYVQKYYNIGWGLK